MINCVDLSTWNDNVNYRAVKSDGVVAAILRAGYGREVSQIDSQFENHYRGCREAGLKIGIYWYSYADSVADAEQEARACLAILNGRAIDLPVYFDMEEAWQTSLGMSTLTAMAERFCETIKAGGYRAGVYSNLNWFYNYLDYDYLKSRYSIWLASETGDISGINGNCDTNVIINRDVISDGAPVDPEPFNPEPTEETNVQEVQRWLNENFNAETADERRSGAGIADYPEYRFRREFGRRRHLWTHDKEKYCQPRTRLTRRLRARSAGLFDRQRLRHGRLRRRFRRQNRERSQDVPKRQRTVCGRHRGTEYV